MVPKWIRRSLGVVAVLLFVASGLTGPAHADVSIGSGDSGTGTINTELLALVDLTLTDGTIEFNTITTYAGLDTFEDSRGSSESASTGADTTDSIAVSNVNSNVNVGAYYKRDGFSAAAYAVNTTNAATLSGLDYATSVSATPKAGQWYDSSATTYRAWSGSSANYPALWIFFDDGYDAGSANPNNDFSQAGGSASGYNGASFTPYIVEVDNASHASGLPDASGEMPAKKWYDGTSPTTSDLPFEAVVVYYLENSTATSSAGKEGTLQSTHVQVLLKAAGDEVMCRVSATSAGADWSATTGWDLARDYSGVLNATAKVDDTTCNIKGNRYTPCFTSTSGVTAGARKVVLCLAHQLPLTMGGTTTAKWYAALAFPREAPRLDYTYTPTINAINWAPIDAQSNTADDRQYP